MIVLVVESERVKRKIHRLLSPLLLISSYFVRKDWRRGAVQLVPISGGYRHQLVEDSQLAAHHHQTAPDHRPAPAAHRERVPSTNDLFF